MKKQTVVVEEHAEHPVERKVLAGAIVEISRTLKALQKSGLTYEAIVVLTHHNCKSPYKYGNKPGLADIKAVLESVSELEKRYTSTK